MAGTETQLYTLAYVLWKGRIMAEEGSVSLDRTTGSQEVKTTAKGYAGESPGAAMVQMQVTSAVPASAFDVDPGEQMENLEEVEVGLLAAGKTLVAKGYIISDSFKHSVDNPSSHEFTFRGAFVKWK